MGPGVPPDDGVDSGNSGSSGNWPGRELLSGASPRQVLAKLCAGDPLEIGPRVREYLSDSSLLVDPQRAVAASAARIAHSAMRYRGSPELDSFLGRNITLAVESLVEEEREQELERVPLDGAPSAHLLFLWKLLGIEPELARRASIAFNRQPAEVRRAFLAVAGSRVSIRDYAGETGEAEAQVRERITRALRSMGEAVGRSELTVEGWEGDG